MNKFITLENENNMNVTYEQRGYIIIPEKAIPLTQKQWSSLELLTDEQNLPYESAQMGDTDESVSIRVFRIKKPRQSTIWHEGLMGLVGSQDMLRLYRKICKNDRFTIDRCQAHLCKTGDFIGRHIDRESYPAYTHSLILAISDNYTGGEMVIYRNKTTESFKIPYRSLLVTDSNIAHEVLPVTSGVRKTIAIFLKE